jgi:hypothetical protein
MNVLLIPPLFVYRPSVTDGTKGLALFLKPISHQANGFWGFRQISMVVSYPDGIAARLHLIGLS